MIDALADILETVRLSGTVFCRAELNAPWGFSTRGMSKGIFHAVVRGRCFLVVEGEAPLSLGSGDMVVLPHGDPHEMLDAPGQRATPLGSMVTASDDAERIDLLHTAGEGPHTSLICGSIEVEHSDAHPLLSLLPRVVPLRGAEPRLSGWIERTLRLIVEELEAGHPGSQTVVTRLADVLLVHALRAHIEARPPGARGWLAGLRDPAIRKALGFIHREPAGSWTAARLASSAGMSRSAFFPRFTELVGESPAHYLTRWRMHVAAKALREERVTVAEAAERVGYGSEAAFSKAFKRVVGLSPGGYRRQRAA